jgi:hypothetical protein
MDGFSRDEMGMSFGWDITDNLQVFWGKGFQIV